MKVSLSMFSTSKEKKQVCGIVRGVDALADAEIVHLGNFQQADAGLHHDLLQLARDDFRLGGQEHEVMNHRARGGGKIAKARGSVKYGEAGAGAFVRCCCAICCARFISSR